MWIPCFQSSACWILPESLQLKTQRVQAPTGNVLLEIRALLLSTTLTETSQSRETLKARVCAPCSWAHRGKRRSTLGEGRRLWLEDLLVHGWDRIKNLHFYSLLALSTHKNVKCYPTMTKFRVRVGRGDESFSV